MEHILTLTKRPSRLLEKIYLFISSKSFTTTYYKELDNEQLAQHLLNDYGDNILRYAYSYVHNMSDAEEILQDTLIKYLKAKPIISDHEHEKAWLLHVASNLAKNKLKYNALRKTDELKDELVTSQTNDLSFVYEAVMSLPLKYREVIHLFYYEGYTSKEIAMILKINEITIRSRLNRARKALKEILKEEYDFGK